MKHESAHSILHRLLRSATDGAKEPVTSARALRLAMARSAERSIGLTLSVIGVTEEIMPLDVLIAQADPAWMLISIGTEDRLVGFAGLDLQARTAVVERQTLGELRAAPAPDRPVTASDAALCAPLVARFLSDFANTAEGTPLTGWTDDLAAGARFDDARAAGMVLPETEMRLVRLSLDFGAPDRQGQLAIALPVHRAATPAPSARPGLPFADMLRARVMEAPASLDAVLARLHLPLSRVEGFEIGQSLPLPGVTVKSVRIEGPDGRQIAEGRLGQITGSRAVRIEAQGASEIAEVRLSVPRTSALPGRVGPGNGTDAGKPGAAPGEHGATGGSGTTADAFAHAMEEEVPSASGPARKKGEEMAAPTMEGNTAQVAQADAFSGLAATVTDMSDS